MLNCKHKVELRLCSDLSFVVLVVKPETWFWGVFFMINSFSSHMNIFHCLCSWTSPEHWFLFVVWCFLVQVLLLFPKWNLSFLSCFLCFSQQMQNGPAALQICFPGGTGLCAGFTRCLVAVQDCQVWCYSFPMLMFIQEGPLLPEQREGAGQLWKHC